MTSPNDSGNETPKRTSDGKTSEGKRSKREERTHRVTYVGIIPSLWPDYDTDY